MIYSKRKRNIIILVSVIISFIVVIPILYTQVQRVKMKKSLTKGYYMLNSVECTDGFGYNATLMVKPSVNVQYETFPETIEALEQTTYHDYETHYVCYGVKDTQRPNTTFTFELDIKVKHKGKSQAISYTTTYIVGSGLWSEIFWFDKLGGELKITFKITAIARC